jgi:hypothetical protein
MHNPLSKHQVFDLSQQSVRDLAWSLWGPVLLEHSAPYTEKDQFPLDLNWLTALDKDSRVLTEYLATKNTYLLGTYFEALWQFYFSHHPRFKHCINNLQVFESLAEGTNKQGANTQRTLGEFDVLVQDEQIQQYHVELTCKFYLEVPINSKQPLWLGPNCRDRLDIKYDKTHSKQLPLLFTEQGEKAATEAFQSINPYQNTDKPDINLQPCKQIAIWRGHLFTQDHWIKQQDLATKLEKLEITEQQGWIIANKKRWLSPVLLTKDETSVLDNSQLIEQVDQYLQEKSSPLMLIRLNFDKARQQWLQHDQYFVTPNNWPHGALADSAETPLRPCSPPV